MASLSKSHVYNAGKHKPDVPKIAYQRMPDGTSERRAERKPMGVTDRFVNLCGSDVTCQLLPAGVPRTNDAIGRARMVLHEAVNSDKTVRGFVEFCKCPLRHGAHLRSPLAEEEFAMLPDDLKRPCASDPEISRVIKRGAGRFVEYGDPCPHIQWLMKSRQERALARRNDRSARAVPQSEIESQKLAIAREQLAEAKKTNEKMLDVVTQATARQPRKTAE